MNQQPIFGQPAMMQPPMYQPQMYAQQWPMQINQYVYPETKFGNPKCAWWTVMVFTSIVMFFNVIFCSGLAFLFYFDNPALGFMITMAILSYIVTSFGLYSLFQEWYKGIKIYSGMCVVNSVFILANQLTGFSIIFLIVFVFWLIVTATAFWLMYEMKPAAISQ